MKKRVLAGVLAALGLILQPFASISLVGSPERFNPPPAHLSSVDQSAETLKPNSSASTQAAPTDEPSESLDIAHRVVVKLAPGADVDQIARAVQAQVVRRGPLNFATLNLISGKFTQALEQLRAQPGVLSAAPSQLIKTSSLNISDTHFPEEWGLKRINAPQAWESGATGKGVTIAIVDTGVDLHHPDLQDRIVQGYNAITDRTNARALQDNNGHGTHVAGIAAAGLNGIGVVGVAYEANIMPVKVMNREGEGSDDVVAAGIVWAADHGAKIINLSLGSVAETDILSEALAYASSKGCLIIAAAGNHTAGEARDVTFPAADPHVVAVNATNDQDQIADFASIGDKVELAAPGEQILSDYWDPLSGSGYAYADGTSMAAPYASGVAALIWSVHPDWTAAQVHKALDQGVKDLGSVGRDEEYGYGLIDASLALEAAAPVTNLTSPAKLSSGETILASRENTPQATLHIPALSFPAGAEINLAPVAAPADLPAGVRPAGSAYSLTWSGQTKRILNLTIKAESSPGTDEVGYIYRWSGSRWIRVGGGMAGESIQAGIYEPGIYRAGYVQQGPIERIGGKDRIETAIDISRTAYPEGSDAVILARADDFPDALAGAPLAYKEHAPILLTEPNELPSAVLDEITRLRPRLIIILGGPGAVAPGIESVLSRYAPVERLWGPDRYATAGQIAKALGTEGEAVIVNGENFPDALSAASRAALEGAPILLTQASQLNPTTEKALKELNVTESLVVGGRGVITDTVYESLPIPIRIAGSNRYATSRAMLDEYPPRGAVIYLTTGEDFPDALAGGVLAAQNASSILLVSPATLSSGDYSEILPLLKGENIIALGGAGAVSDALLSALRR